jgi:uncharacterized protein YyaL (SSP411 family)
MPNRLASEQSPYLLQHQHNPVDWYPWGEEAFARARGEDRPIFLSIGYSTCHWCHVMEHESFENPRIAEVLNQHFVSIKVDREERPDVDRVYMTFIQATSGGGGWPMSVWLPPALEPFYGGTYFPPASRWGRPGFVEVLEEVARVWREERAKVLQSAATIVDRLRAIGSTTGGSGGVPGVGALEKTAREFAGSFDARRGGFGDAPKFPRPSELLFLLREYYRSHRVTAGAGGPASNVLRDIVLLTLRAMALGGMRDHIGGGFHRYSVDGDWRVPHFEKMLYDQAQLVLAYVEAAQVSGDPFYADVARDTLSYVRRDLADPAGGFYSAEDADSVPPEAADVPDAHKSEGAFYIWGDDEIGDALGADADIVRAHFGIRPEGNAPADPHQEFTGRNLLYTARSIEDLAAESGRSADDIRSAIDRARLILREVRSRRPRPHLDDKVLTAWNGLMIAAFARAARALPKGEGGDGGDPGYLADAGRAAAFIRTHLWDSATRTLRRRYRAGESGVDGYAEDYAYLVFGLLELFQADGDPAWLDWAIDLQRRQDELFWDADGGGWFGTAGTDPSVLLRMKEDYDGAEPAASSVSALNLLVLGHLTGDAAYATRAEQTFAGFARRIDEFGRAVPMMLAALGIYHLGMPQMVIVGAEDAAQPLAAEVRRHYLPNAIVIPAAAAHRDGLARTLPWVAPMLARPAAAAYVCRDFACERPVFTAEALRALIDSLREH